MLRLLVVLSLLSGCGSKTGGLVLELSLASGVSVDLDHVMVTVRGPGTLFADRQTLPTSGALHLPGIVQIDPGLVHGPACALVWGISHDTPQLYGQANFEISADKDLRVPITLSVARADQNGDQIPDEIVDDCPVMAKVTHLEIPQPIYGEAFDSAFQSLAPLSQIPHFVATNTGTITFVPLFHLYFSYHVQESVSGGGFGTAGYGKAAMIAPGESDSENFTQTTLAPGDYQALACAWGQPELPDGYAVAPTFDARHCMQTQFTVSPGP